MCQSSRRTGSSPEEDSQDHSNGRLDEQLATGRTQLPPSERLIGSHLHLCVLLRSLYLEPKCPRNVCVFDSTREYTSRRIHHRHHGNCPIGCKSSRRVHGRCAPSRSCVGIFSHWINDGCELVAWLAAKTGSRIWSVREALA